LSKTFVAHVLYGENALSGELLLNSFRSYVSHSERTLIDRCLNNEVEEDDEELLEFLSNFVCKVLPRKSSLRRVLEEVMHEELIQKPQYITECWKEIVLELKSFLPSPESISEVFECLVPTNVKVIDALRVEPTNDAERESASNISKDTFEV
jgi:hypothetical protein